MTATNPPTVTTPVTQAPTPAPTKSLDDIAVDAIVEVYGHSHDFAGHWLNWFRGIVDKSVDGPYLMTTEELEHPFYELMDELFPHGQRYAAPDTPRAAVEAAVLDPAKGQLAFVHRQLRMGELIHCTTDTTTEVFAV